MQQSLLDRDQTMEAVAQLQEPAAVQRGAEDDAAVEAAVARARGGEGGARARNEDEDDGNESADERLTARELDLRQRELFLRELELEERIIIIIVFIENCQNAVSYNKRNNKRIH